MTFLQNSPRYNEVDIVKCECLEEFSHTGKIFTRGQHLGNKMAFAWRVFFPLLFAETTWLAVHGESNKFISDEHKLITDLLKDYNPAVRPAANATHKVVVHLQMTTLHIVELNEKTQVLETLGWISQHWKDFQLSWDPKKYGGVQMIRLPAEQVWKPDIVLVNNAKDQNIFAGQHANLVVVSFNGEVLWVPQLRMKSDCKLDMTHFPHDTQMCRINLGSWTHDFSKLDIRLAGNTSGSFYMETKEWDVLAYTRERKVLIYGDTRNGTRESQMAPVVVYTMKLARNSPYLQQLCTLPCLALALIIIFQFLIPPEAGERMVIGVGSLVSITIMLLILEGYMPNEMKDLPTPALYLFYLCVMSSLGIVISVVTLNCHHRDIKKGKVPQVLRKILLGSLGQFMCMKGDAYASVPTQASGMDTATDMADLNRNNRQLTNSSNQLEATLEDIRKYLKILASKAQEPEYVSHRQLVVNEWHQVALVLDRLTFWVYLVLTFVVTIVIFVR